MKLGVDVDACAVLHRKLRDLTFNLVVAGQFKRGKSSLLNALLGDDLLPVGVIPLTSVVTLIRDGPTKAATVELEDGREQSISFDDLSSYVTERGNPHNVLAVRQVVIDHPSSWLGCGVHLVDTPGIGSVYDHNTDVAREYLPNADAVLFVTSVDQPLSRAELDFLQNIRQYAEKIFCVLNKIDYLNDEEMADSIGFVRGQLRDNLGSEVPLFAVSARLALQAKQQNDGAALVHSGFPDFEQSLRDFLTGDKEEVLLRSIARSLLRLLSQSRFACELEVKVLTAPQQQLEANLAAFGRRRVEIERSSADHLVLLDADAK
ncbi:MAG TPA: dynamin family protein [Steroidobacteraceae bacterium]|nr:dynamin family protein [Steroidobacteraceae bacterium]